MSSSVGGFLVHRFIFEIRLKTCDITIARSIRLSDLRAAHRHGVGLIARLVPTLDQPRDRWVLRVRNVERAVVLVIIASGRGAHPVFGTAAIGP